MPQILFPETKLFTPTPADLSEAARYLGYRKISAPDQMIQKLINDCCQELLACISPAAVIENFDLSVSENKIISFGDLTFNSVDLGRNLEGCSKVYIFASTIGPKVDACIRKANSTDTVKAAVLQSCGAMYIEKVVDYINDHIKKEAAASGLKTKPRYSPGYGDIPLEMQKDFFRLLPCTRIGLTLMDTLIMSPEKSVTAFIGAGNF
ncbi:MAG: hypothetical protein MJ179_01365 [Treponema sp.]|nr:hypothetical protein [Treponema sp.]